MALRYYPFQTFPGPWGNSIKSLVLCVTLLLKTDGCVWSAQGDPAGDPEAASGARTGLAAHP